VRTAALEWLQTAQKELSGGFPPDLHATVSAKVDELMADKSAAVKSLALRFKEQLQGQAPMLTE
jgi:hypothetical protein